MDEMIGNAEEFCQSLGIPYRVVNIVSGREKNKRLRGGERDVQDSHQRLSISLFSNLNPNPTP